MTTQTKSAVWTVCLTVAAAAALIGAIEFALRAAGIGYDAQFFIRGNDGYLHANRHFGRLFFPESTLREGFTGRLRDPKQEGTFRIFFLGESAAMGFPSPRFGPARVLECLIREAFPGKPVEVVNASVAGISSHGVLRVAEEVSQLQPDALVIYMGNNEVVGPFGPGSIVAGGAVPLWKARAAIALRSTKIGQAVDGWIDRISGVDEMRWTGMQMFVDRRVSPTDPAMPLVYASFRSNLRDILAMAERKKTPVYLCTVAVNTEDFWPLAGPEAISAYARASVLRQDGESEKASELFEKARDLDELRFRADSTINSIIREQAARAHSDVKLVDVQEIFATRPDGLSHADLFWEHVHLTFRGNYQLAKAMLQSLLPRLETFFNTKALALPDENAVASKIGFTPLEHGFAAETILRMLTQQPFTGQPDIAARGLRVAKQLRQLREAWDRKDKTDLAAELAAEAGRFPDDVWQKVALAQTLEASGRAPEAVPLKRAVADEMPLSVFALKSAGVAELEAGNYPEARKYLLAARALDRRMAEIVVRLSACAMLEGNPGEAREILVTFLEENPRSTEAWLALSQIARWQKQFEEARDCVGQALKAEPGSPAALRELEMINLESSTRGDPRRESAKMPQKPVSAP